MVVFFPRLYRNLFLNLFWYSTFTRMVLVFLFHWSLPFIISSSIFNSLYWINNSFTLKLFILFRSHHPHAIRWNENEFHYFPIAQNSKVWKWLIFKKRPKKVKVTAEISQAMCRRQIIMSVDWIYIYDHRLLTNRTHVPT